MNRIEKAFSNKKAFIGFLMAGDPTLDKTEDYVLALERGGADIVEIGIPFSDPIAEGKVIERAARRALQNRVTTDDVFKLVTRLRDKTNIPLVFLTYLNPVFKYGYKRFFENCKMSGVDGIIIPDLPFEERGEVLEHAKSHGVCLITLIAPTSNNRIQILAKEAEGFVYCVSSLGVTGIRSAFNADIKETVQKIKAYTNTPVAIGFGISTPEQAKQMCSFADGAIVGSRIVKIVEEFGENAEDTLYEYAKLIADAINHK